MPPTADELWGTHLMPATIVVDVLLPNGLLIEILCSREATLETIKEEIWLEARKQILFRLLSEPSSYIFVAVTQDAKVEEFYDETKRLCDLRLFQPLLKLTEPKGNKEEKILNFQIGLAIGRPLHDFDQIKDPETMDFRRNLLNLCKDVVEHREKQSKIERAYYSFPPDFDEAYYSLQEQSVKTKTDFFCVWMMYSDKTYQHSEIELPQDALPEDLIVKALVMSYTKGNNLSLGDHSKIAQVNKDNYTLKVCGMEQYLLGNHPLRRYKYIQKCFSQGKKPQLLLMELIVFFQKIPNCTFLNPSFLKRAPQIVQVPVLEAISSQQLMSLWKADCMLKIKILSAAYVNVKEVDEIYVQAAIYHGPESLCEARKTNRVTPQNPRWDESLEYDLYIPDIPRSARLCLSICAVTFRSKKREEFCAISYCNIQFFNYKNCLLSDKINLNFWPMPKGHDELLHPLGMLGSNPNRDSSCLQIEFDRFSPPAVFPPDPLIEEYASFVMECERKKDLPAFSETNIRQCCDTEITETDLSELQEIVKRDPLSELSEQEKDFLWRMRLHCLKIPDSLPKLLDAVKWNSRDEISQLYVLLRQWPKVKVETALELFDCKYVDPYVRRFAVNWLDQGLTDDLLLQYLLQLVQVLKKEPYLASDLAYFLLKRSLMNSKIGHFFFWHLKAEMHDPINSLRCGLLLEAYLRGLSTVSLHAIVKQVEALGKLENLSDILKERKDDTQRDRVKFLYDHIRRADYFEALKDLLSPLNSSVILGSLLVEECRIMDSAKRPLWLVWSNPDAMAVSTWPTNAIIFKTGDDLRQDMLTLQVIRVMDLIWRRANLDLKLLPYGCLATGRQVGMIEVVRNAKTVMNIQRSGGRMAAFQVDASQLNKWIKENNKDDYDQAVDKFTKSCAGYCVATFILGIGDRNPDNIMINEDGQIFHIDFGHFLGHFKKKFGINRERVPFVLTFDFIRVISKGSETPLKSKEFANFQKLCGDAYLALHDHANLLITLFAMMLSTGIPELQSMDDIAYLRQTLQVEKSREEALAYFEAQLDEAHGGAWSTKLDWFFHSVKHSSKT